MARRMMVLAGLAIVALAMTPEPAEARPCYGWICSNSCVDGNCNEARCLRVLSEEGFCGCDTRSRQICDHAGQNCTVVNFCVPQAPLCTRGCEFIPPYFAEGLRIESFEAIHKALVPHDLDRFAWALAGMQKEGYLVDAQVQGGLYQESIPNSENERGEPKYYPGEQLSIDLEADAAQAEFIIRIGETRMEGTIWDRGNRGFTLVYEEGSPKPLHIDW